LDKDKFGSLTFDQIYPLRQRLQKIFTELEELGYRDILSQQEIDQVDQYVERFLNHLKQLAGFNLTTGFNKEVHDNYDNTIKGLYGEVFRNLRGMIVFLRQEAAQKSQDVKELQKQQKIAVQAEKEYKSLTNKLRHELETLQKNKQEVESKRGEVAAVRFGKHFEAQAKENANEAKKWLRWRDIFFIVLLILIIANVLGYFVLFIISKIRPDGIKPTDFFTIEYGLAKLALLSILSYGISFSSRNFNVNSNLLTLNKHRKNVAETLNDFLESKPDPADRSKIVESATGAMFKHEPIGYLPKIETKDDGPVASFWNILKPI
jgi:hypothetical protein